MGYMGYTNIDEAEKELPRHIQSVEQVRELKEPRNTFCIQSLFLSRLPIRLISFICC